MQRKQTTPRTDYKNRLKAVGFEFGDQYWSEGHYYVFSKQEIEAIELASKECYKMYIEAVQYMIDNYLFKHVPPYIVSTIVDSWNSDEPSVYGRFDFAMINGVPKLLEFNADTPTSLFEASVIQWFWKLEAFPTNDQYNNIHDMLIASWKEIHERWNSPVYHFAVLKDNLEDYTTVAYLCSTAVDAGLTCKIIDIAELNFENNSFYDSDDLHIDFLFKLYPYEWLFKEDTFGNLSQNNTTFIEPFWKALMSNKYVLKVLYDLFPNSPYLLKTMDEPKDMINYCKKPIFSREGANVLLVKDQKTLEETQGEYGSEGYVYQELVEIESHQSFYPIIGSWIIGGEPCGMGIRESKSRITDNFSYFIPHIIE